MTTARASAGATGVLVLCIACAGEAVNSFRSIGVGDPSDSGVTGSSPDSQSIEPKETLGCSLYLDELGPGVVVIDRCSFGQTCAPFVEVADGGAPDAFGTRCVPVGDGVEGASCAGEGDCMPGLMCKGSLTESMCATICRLDEPSDCREGFACQALQLGNFGGCMPI